MTRKGKYRGGIDKKIPHTCMFKIYEGIYAELMKQKKGKKSLKDAITSWERKGGLRKLRKHYSQLSTGSVGPMYKEPQVFFMVAYKRITQIFNEVRSTLQGKSIRHDHLPIRKINLNERDWVEFQKKRLDEIEKKVNSNKLKIWEAVSEIHAHWSGQLHEVTNFEYNWRLFCKHYKNDEETADAFDNELWKEVSQAYLYHRKPK